MRKTSTNKTIDKKNRPKTKLGIPPWFICPISEKTVWHVVKKTAACMNIPRLAPHDLRRSCARLCHDSGGELEQIQFLLGHVSVQTTERYIGCKQRLKLAVNDRLGIEPG